MSDDERRQEGGSESPEDSVSRRALLIARVLLAVIGVALAIVIGEVGVRLVAPQQLIIIRPDLWEPADTVGWLRRPNVRTQINTGERTVTVLTDAEGFRMGTAAPPRTAGLHILILGDSQMEALQVEYEQSTAGRLETSLQSLTEEPVAVHNGGVAGWGTNHYVLRARTLLSRHEYDLVITALYMGDDIIPERKEYFAPRTSSTRPPLRVPRALSRAELIEAILLPINNFLEVRSHLFVFLKNRVKTLRMQLGVAPMEFPSHFYTSDASGERWAVTAELLADIDDQARQTGAASLTVMVPTPFQVDSASFMQYVRGYGIDPATVDLDQPNRRLQQELEARGLQFYDPLPAFRAAHESGIRLHGRVDPHPTPEGHRILVAGLTPIVAELLESRQPNQ